jgi:hypothetical protein
MMPAGSRVRLGPVHEPLSCKSAHHVIKRAAIVGVNLVELAQRNVVDRFPRFAAVVSDRDAAVLSVPHSFRVLRIEPERVKVDVRAAGDRTKRLPPSTEVNNVDATAKMWFSFVGSTRTRV